jgi:hypothetical protein
MGMVFLFDPFKVVIRTRSYNRQIGGILCGGGFEYLHRSPASRRRRRKVNPVPGDITESPSSREIWIREPGLEVRGSLESENLKCAHESHGTRTGKWLRWREPTAIVNDRPILSSERMLHKDYNGKCSVEKVLVVSRILSPRKTDWR